MLPWRKYINKLNEFGLGEFTARQVLWRVTFYFNGVEIGRYDRNITGGMFYCKSLGPPLPISRQLDEDLEKMVLTALFGAALSVHLWKGAGPEGAIVTKMRRAVDDRWLILPPNIGTTGKYFILIPTIAMETDPSNYEIEVELVPWEKGGGVSLFFRPQEMPDGQLLEKAAAIISV
jgi:hypothetical protein